MVVTQSGIIALNKISTQLLTGARQRTVNAQEEQSRTLKVEQ